MGVHGITIGNRWDDGQTIVGSWCGSAPFLVQPYGLTTSNRPRLAHGLPMNTLSRAVRSQSSGDSRRQAKVGVRQAWSGGTVIRYERGLLRRDLDASLCVTEFDFSL